jgi:hypothetical protein
MPRMTPLVGILLLIGVIVLGVVVYAGYRASQNVSFFYFERYLPMREVAGLKVTAAETEEGTQLTVTGLNANSAQCVLAHKKVVRGDTLVLLISSGLSNGNCSGNVEYVLTLTPDIRHVAIKNVKDIIWSRGENQ